MQTLKQSVFLYLLYAILCFVSRVLLFTCNLMYFYVAALVIFNDQFYFLALFNSVFLVSTVFSHIRA